MKKTTTYFSALLIILLFSEIEGRDFRVGQVPNGFRNSCNTCHTNGGGTPRNEFGKMVEARFLDSGGNVLWGPELAMLDSDGDGVTNGQELQDPYGMWTSGASGNSALVTNAGLASSVPTKKLTVNFASMNPHVDQTLWLRVVDKSTMNEVGRISTTISASFNVELTLLLVGSSYFVDFFADFNNNGIYDAPPTDHAWREELDNVAGDESISFTHNTNFVDIGWDYMVNVDFSSMTPHVGQMLEMRVVDTDSGLEVGRVSGNVPSAAYTAGLPGIKIGGNYNVDFYADFNKNGVYDAPPTDHAWRETITNATGDETIGFTHNTSFTDIEWKYQLVMNFLSMTPHVGQKLELRVYDSGTDFEVYRTSLDEILLPNFTVYAPGLTAGANYNVDFYADLNSNGSYDVPPSDHAWRETLTSIDMNQYVNWSHNTSFTDIQWPAPTGVIEENGSFPEGYLLSQNYPNPFNPTTNIKFSLVESGFVSLKVYDLLGEQVAELVNENMNEGSYQVDFNAANLSSGVYIYRIQANDFIETKTMMLLK